MNILKQAIKNKKQIINEHQAKKILTAYNIPVVQESLANTLIVLFQFP